MKVTAVILSLCLAFLCSCQSSQSKKVEAPFEPNLELLELIKKVEAAITDVKHPGREYANRLRGDSYKMWFKYWQTGKSKPNGSQGYIVRDIKKILVHIEAGKTWPKAGSYKIPKAQKAPVIDGKLDDPAWKNAATWTEIYRFNKTEKGGPKSTWKLTWDDTHLYIAFDFADTDISAEKRKRDGHIYNDDCAEIMIMPDFKFRTYWEIGIAPNGSVYDSIQCKDGDKWGMNTDPKQNVPGMKHAQVINGTINKPDDVDTGYTVEISVPFSSLPGYSRAKPAIGQKLHFIMVRLDRNQGKFTPYAFRPLLSWGHNIWNHAEMILAK